MKRLALALALAAAPATAQLAPATLETVAARPPAGARLPALTFRDPAGRAVRLAPGAPTILLFADFTCRHVCAPGLALTAAALADVPGEWRLVVIGLDAKDTAQQQRAFAAKLAAFPTVAPRATVLATDAATVAQATRALGFRAAYDAASDQYAHPTVAYVFARDGRLAALLPELALRPDAMRAALAAPVPQQAPSLAERVATLCYGLATQHGAWSAAIVMGLQLVTAALVLASGIWFLRLRRRA